MSDPRRANYIALTADGKKLDYLNADYTDVKFALPVKEIFIVTDAFEANLPGIAFDRLGDTGWWWLLGLYNGIIDPIDDVVTGLRLNVFDLSQAKRYLESRPDQGVLPTNVITL
jgi:hypothetical protein